MGFVGLNCEDELRISSSTIEKLKFPKKFSDDCSSVCHLSVPRKLRSSAMKKKCSETVSPPLQVPNNLNCVADGDQLLGKDDSMKSKLKMKRGESEGLVADYILDEVTKDEVEVAEALYALSGVSPCDVPTAKTKSTRGRSGAKSSNVTKTVGGGKDGLRTVIYEDNAMPDLSSNAAGSVGKTVRFHCPNDTTQPGGSIGKQPSLDSDIPEVNLHLTAFTSENQQAIQKALCDSVSGAWTPSRKSRSKLPKLEKSLANFKYQEIVLPPIAAAGDQTEVQHTSKDVSSSRSDMSPAVSCVSKGPPIPSKLCIAKLPAWIESTSCSTKSSTLKTNVLAKKGAQFSTDSKNSWKRCSAHVYICRFIKAVQNEETNDRSLMQPVELTMNEAPELVDLTGGQNCSIGVVSSDTLGGCSPASNATEVKNAIRLHKRLVKDQQQASMLYESSDFFCMPAGRGLETSDGIIRATNGLDASTSVRLRSQNQASIPFYLQPSRYSSTSFSGHCPAAPLQQVQLPSYLGSKHYGPPSVDANASAAQPLEQQQRQLPLPLMADFKSGLPSPSMPNKQTGQPDITFLQNVQTTSPHSLTSLQVLGSTYAPILQQQQLISATTLFPSSSPVKGQYHHIPSVYEPNVRHIRPDNVSLQIICNQHIKEYRFS